MVDKLNGKGNGQARPASILEEALKLHAMGFWVVPCNGKMPVMKGWQKRQATPEDLRSLLAEPGRNFGIALHQSGFVDIDCDSPEAPAILAKLFPDGIPLTPAWRSKRGIHYLFRRPDALLKNLPTKKQGIEFRGINGTGHQSLIPPSLNDDGTKREWLPGQEFGEVEIAELPQKLIEWLADGQCNTHTRRKSRGRVDAADATANGPILEGERNNSLFEEARRLRDMGMSQEESLAKALEWNQQNCSPPDDERKVHSTVKSVFSRPPYGEGKESLGLKKALERIEPNLELWHTPEGKAYATTSESKRRTFPLESTRAKHYVLDFFRQDNGPAIYKELLSNILVHLQAKAIEQGKEYHAHLRTAGHGDCIYIDNAGENGLTIKVSPDGWEPISDPPVKFVRPPGMLPLPMPVRDGDIDELRRFVNVRNDAEFQLLLTWLLSTFRPRSLYAILFLQGEHGSAKSTTATVLRSLCDPNEAPLRSPVSDERNLQVEGRNSYFVVANNVSEISSRLSDAYCRLSTDGGFSIRKMYTDDDEALFTERRPIIVTSITDLDPRSDLADRGVFIETPSLPDEKRMDPDEFQKSFNEARPRLFGVLLDILVRVLKELPGVTLPKAPRMAGFARWGVACERAMNWPNGSFLAAYNENILDISLRVLTDSILWEPWQKYFAKNPQGFAGQQSVLLEYLTKEAGEDVVKQRGFPKQPNQFSKRLKEIQPALRKHGYEMESKWGGPRRNEKWIVVRPLEQKPSAASAASAASRENTGFSAADPPPMPPINPPPMPPMNENGSTVKNPANNAVAADAADGFDQKGAEREPGVEDETETWQTPVDGGEEEF